MDYFYWDEIFGGRQSLAQSLFEEPDEDEGERLTTDLVSVVIVWSEDASGPHGR